MILSFLIKLIDQNQLIIFHKKNKLTTTPHNISYDICQSYLHLMIFWIQ